MAKTKRRRDGEPALHDHYYCWACSEGRGTTPDHDACSGKCGEYDAIGCAVPCPCPCNEPLTRNELMKIRVLTDRIKL